MIQSVPVITIDGPSGTGKGTLAALLAKQLGFYLLDSGALYRALAWTILEQSIDPKKEQALNVLLKETNLELRTHSPVKPPEIWCNGRNVNEVIRQESVSNMASKIATIPMVRQYLVQYQRMMRRMPGLIADGRDMGSVIFPEAIVKFYLDARLETRVERRLKQLKAKGVNVNLHDIRQNLIDRDARDENRKLSPMKCMSDMIRIDTSDLDINAVFDCMRVELQERLQSY